MPSFFANTPSVIAHRGASGRAPENTLAAIRLAWETGADAVEIDVRLTADNRIAVIHDASTFRTSGVDLDVRTTPSSILRGLDMGSIRGAAYAGEKLPFLEEVLATIPPGRRLVIEIKCGEEILTPLETAVDQSGKRGQLMFIGFEFALMRRCREQFPDIPALWLCVADTPPGGKSLFLGSDDFCAPVGDALRAVRAAGLDGIDVGHDGVIPDLVRAADAEGLETVVWTVNDPARAKLLSEMGVRAITTDEPERIREAFSPFGDTGTRG